MTAYAAVNLSFDLGNTYILASLVLYGQRMYFPQNSRVLKLLGVTNPFGYPMTSIENLSRKMHILKIVPIISGFSVPKAQGPSLRIPAIKAYPML